MSRRFVQLICALLLSIPTFSCSSSSKLREQTAANSSTAGMDAVEPVTIRIADGRSTIAVPETTPTDALDFSVALPAAPTPASSVPVVPAVPATPPTTIDIQIPVATPPPTTAVPTTGGRATMEPTTGPPTAAPTTAASTTTPRTVSPTTGVRATGEPTTTVGVKKPRGPFAVAGAPCSRSQRDALRLTRKGVSLRCTVIAKRGRWVAVDLTAGATAPTVTSPGIAPGFDGATIRIGLLTTTTHPIWGSIGKAISAGIDARIAAINRRGGIGGRYKVVVVRAETNYDPVETLAQIQATKNSVAAYVSLLGTPSTEASEPVLRAEGLLASPASQEARWATAPNLLPVFNSYQIQAINGIAYFAEQFQATNPGVRPVVCGVSVATSFGEAGSEGLRVAAQLLPVSLGPVVSVAANESGFASAIGILKGAGCQATFLTVGPVQTLGIVLTARQLSFVNRWIIMGAAFSDRIVTPQTGPLFEQGAWVVGDGTQWGDETVPGMMQLKADLLASDNRYWTENPDIGLSYGWAQARTIEQVLETAVARNDLSRSGLLIASQAMGTVDLGGIGSPTNYSEGVRLANARTTIFNVDNSYRNAIRVLARDYTSAAAQSYRR